MQNIRRPFAIWGHRVDILGRVVRLLLEAFSVPSIRDMDRHLFFHYFTVIGLRALPLITWGSLLISLAITTQVVLEAQRFNVEDMSGAGIAIGLLRELAPLTVGLSWTGRTAAFLAETAFARAASEKQFSGAFLAPAYLAGIAAALPLSAYGLVVGFGSAALFSPLVGATSTADFLESARQTIRDKDIAVYLVKLVIINPTIVIFATSLVTLDDTTRRSSVTASAVSYACVGVFIANLVCTWAWYLP